MNTEILTNIFTLLNIFLFFLLIIMSVKTYKILKKDEKFIEQYNKELLGHAEYIKNKRKDIDKKYNELENMKEILEYRIAAIQNKDEGIKH